MYLVLGIESRRFFTRCWYDRSVSLQIIHARLLVSSCDAPGSRVPTVLVPLRINHLELYLICPRNGTTVPNHLSHCTAHSQRPERKLSSQVTIGALKRTPSSESPKTSHTARYTPSASTTATEAATATALAVPAAAAEQHMQQQKQHLTCCCSPS